VQDCVGFVGLLLQLLDRLLRWQDQKFNFAALSFALHFLHDRQCSSAGAGRQLQVASLIIFYDPVVLGAGYFILTAYVPLLLITHGLAFRILLRTKVVAPSCGKLSTA